MSGLTVTKTNIVPSHIVLFDGDAAIKLGRDGTVTLGPKWGNANDAAAAFLDALTRHVEGWNTRPQPTTSVDAEQVWRGHLDTACELIQEAKGVEGPDSGYVTDHLDAAENWIERAVAAIQAYGDARADAARREALEEAAKVARDYASKAAQRGWVLKPGSIVTAARHIATTIRALKENPNAG